MGNAVTSASERAPAAIITRRSKPSATPAQGGNPASMAASSRLSVGKGGLPSATRWRFAAAIRERSTVGVQKLVVAVGQLDSLDIEFEPLGDRRRALANTGQGRLAGRIIEQNRRPRPAEMWLNAFDQQQIEPAVAIVAEACRRSDSVPFGRLAEVCIRGSMRIEADVARKRFTIVQSVSRTASKSDSQNSESKSIPSLMPSPARYHSIIVNSGLCSGPVSPLRKARVI